MDNTGLKISDIAVYLPYGLKIYTLDDDFKIVIQTIKNIHFNGKNGNSSIETSEGWDLEYHEFKPVLRQLADLKQMELREIISHIFRDGKSPRPQMESVKHDRGYITFYDLDTCQTYVAVKPGHDDLPVMNMSNSFDDYSVFFKLHVDMKNLIGRGLAISNNDIYKQL